MRTSNSSKLMQVAHQGYCLQSFTKTLQNRNQLITHEGNRNEILCNNIIKHQADGVQANREKSESMIIYLPFHQQEFHLCHSHIIL